MAPGDRWPAKASHEASRDQTIAQPRGRGRCDAEVIRQVPGTARPFGEYDERPVLDQRHIGIEVGHRLSRQGDQDPAGPK